jgi:phosphoribosylformylglycinamidine cyclo-ligase
MDNLTYKHSGVDIDLADETKSVLKEILSTENPRVLNEVGAYGALFDIKFEEYRHPVLVFKTEEPGSKQLLAFEHDSIESVCFDMINHLVNDCIAEGGKPLCVQDCIVCGKLEKDKVIRVVKAIAAACREQECVLTGGEISEQPGVLQAGQYILTSSAIAIVDKDNIIDGSAIEEGDVVIALESSGFHTNGYSLIRELLRRKPSLADRPVSGKTFLEQLLIPHRCYYQALKDLKPPLLRGIAHITGGGIRDNLRRVLPKHLSAEVDLALYQIPEVFRFIRTEGEIADREMLRTFNLGVGLALVVAPEQQDYILHTIRAKGLASWPIGKIIKGDGEVQLKGKLPW